MAPIYHFVTTLIKSLVVIGSAIAASGSLTIMAIAFHQASTQGLKMISISERRDIVIEQILPIYEANGWSAAQKPQALHQALMNSHGLVSAWEGDRLVGIGNAISDGFLVVYYPHLVVHPDYQGQGIGQRLMARLQKRYADLHMQILVADGEAIAFYEKYGFSRAGKTEPMWIYSGGDH